MIFSLLNHHNILINSETECMWPLQGTQGHIAASTTTLYVTSIWIMQQKKASSGLMDVVWRNKMIKRKISSTWVKRFQCLTAVFTPACFILCIWTSNNRIQVKIWKLRRPKWAGRSYTFWNNTKVMQKRWWQSSEHALVSHFLMFSSYQSQNEFSLSDLHISLNV